MSEKHLGDVDEVLFRQIHPNCIEGGVPASDRFRPSSLDSNLLSTDRSQLTSAEAAYALYMANGRQSAAVFGLTVGEFNGESIACMSDPIEPSVGTTANPAHAVADYSGHPLSDQKVVAKRLTRLAVARGKLHPST